MKSKKLTTGKIKVLPHATKKQRLVIYKLALKEVKKQFKDWNQRIFIYTDQSDGICIILPDLISRRDIRWRDAPNYFPEFAKYHSASEIGIPPKIKFEKLFYSDLYAWRIKILNKCIEDCQK